MHKIIWSGMILTLIALTAMAETSFTHIDTLLASANPYFKFMIDLDQDGLDDLIIGSNYSIQRWYKSNGDDTFTEHTLHSGGTTGSGGWCADIDGDGDIDVLIGGTLYFNPLAQGGDIFNPWPNHSLVSTSVHDARIADLDNDGKLDIVLKKESSATVDICYQDNPTSWTKVSANHVFGSNGLELADINLDGNIDMVFPRHWLKNPGTRVGSWSNFVHHSSWDAYGAITSADINRDGRPDIVLAVSENTLGPCVWLENPLNPESSGPWISHYIDSENLDSCHQVWVTDFDLDGNLDVVTSEFRGQYKVLVYYGVGDGSAFTRSLVANVESHNIAIGDYDGDGDVDMFSTHVFDAAPIHLFRNDLPPQERSLDSWQYIQVDSQRTQQDFGLTSGDLNHDGFLDIIAGSYAYFNPTGDMTGTWNRMTLPQNADANFVLDVDGDARADILSQDLPNIHWLEATDSQASSFVSRVVASGLGTTGHGSSQGFAVGEIYGGGRPEYILTTGDGIYYLQIPSNPESTPWTLVHVTSNAPEEGIALGDVDGDGDLDITGWIGSGSGSQVIGWFENPGNGQGNWTQYGIGTVQGTEGDRIEMGDINQDGRTDVIATGTSNSATGSYLYWFEAPTNPKTNPSWTRYTVASNVGALNSMRVADMNVDGLLDIVTSEHRGSKQVIIWENNLQGSNWIPHIVETGKEGHLGAYLADLDMDGDLEIMNIAWDEYPYLHLWRNDALIGGSQKVVTPVIQPESGSYVGSVNVSMSTVTPGAELRYTLDGQEPDIFSTLYTGSLNLDQSVTLKVRAFKANLTSSDVALASYTVTPDTTPPQIVSVKARGIANEIKVEFDEALENTSATNLGNYSVSGILLTNAQLLSDGRTVTLDLGENLTENTTYTLSVVDVLDLSGNGIDSPVLTQFTYTSILVSDGLAAYYSFDEGNGSIVSDSKENFPDGQIFGAQWIDGKLGQGLNFSGSQHKVDLGTINLPSNIQTSIALWFKADTFNVADARLISKSTGTANDDHYFMISTVNSGGIKLRFRLKAGGATTTLVADSTINASEWIHVVTIYDGSSMKIYQNGILVGSIGKSGTITTNNTVGVTIGLNPDQYGPFDGIIDELRIYDRALSEEEINELFLETTPVQNITLVQILQQIKNRKESSASDQDVNNTLKNYF